MKAFSKFLALALVVASVLLVVSRDHAAELIEYAVDAEYS